jgi:Putative addiction module component
MPDPVAELVERGKSLSPEDRARLVDLLLETLEGASTPGVEAAWRTELRSRISAYERGEAVLYDADEVIAEATRLTQ